MAIQSAGGTYVNTTWTSDGTRSDMQSQVRNALITAGWSVVSGGGTSDTLLQSATTPQGMRCLLRCLDSGSGNCAQFTMRDLAGIRISSAAFMLPLNSQQFRIIANKYQFFVFPTGPTDPSTARKIMMGGVPYLDSDMSSIVTTPDMFWFLFTGETDITTTARPQQFRRNLTAATNASGPAGSSLFNDGLVNYTAGGSSNAIPQIALLYLRNAGSNDSAVPPWKTTAYPIIDALIGWGASSASSNMLYMGQLWDSVVIMATMDGELPIVLPPDVVANYLSITHQNTSFPYGTLVTKVQ